MNDTNADISEWIINEPYVPRNVICFLIRGFQAPNPEDQEFVTQSLRSAFELQAIAITGLTSGFGHETMPKNNVEFTFHERYGRPFDKLFEYWFIEHARHLHSQREASYRHMNTLTTGGNDREQTHVASSVDLVFVEPDPTHCRVMKAWVAMHALPLHYSGIVSKRDIGGLPSKPSAFPKFRNRRKNPSVVKPVPVRLALDADWYTGAPIERFAQLLVDRVNIQAADPRMRDMSKPIPDGKLQHFGPEHDPRYDAFLQEQLVEAVLEPRTLHVQSHQRYYVPDVKTLRQKEPVDA